MTIALTGNPNSGKTTLFNALTGSSQYVGNWPGVTVEKKEGRLKGAKDVLVTDLPGIYSLSPYTPEEVVARNYLLNDRPDVILNIVDASNLERNLYLTTQLLELSIPVVVALNMMDVVEKNGGSIDAKALSKALCCPVVEISALKGRGIKEVTDAAISLAQTKQGVREPQRFSETLETALMAISTALKGVVAEADTRFYAVKLFERDEKALEALKLSAEAKERIEAAIAQCETTMDDDSESIVTGERYTKITHILKGVSRGGKKQGLSVSDKIDRIVTNRWLALPIFAAMMFLVYYVSVTTVGAWATDWTNDVLFGEIIPPAITSWLEGANAAPWLVSLVVDGIIGGVGAVLGFLPQMLVLFFMLALLEDCGYMARVAFIMDRIFRKFGLSGKSFIPMLISTGCGVPGIMASRTIENERDRRMTIMTTTFMPCGAKLPIIALIAGALFGGQWWVAPSAYFIGIAAIIVSGIMLKKLKSFAGQPAPFVMELPAYHLPGIKGVLIHMWDRGKSFVKKAGTVIFLACGLIWFLSTFSWRFEMVNAADSMLAAIGSVFAPIFTPLGWGEWRAAVATITGLVAKENVVGTFGILYGFAEVAEDGAEVWSKLQTAFTSLSGYSFLVFNLLCAPCFAAIGAIKREMGNGKWTLIAVGYQTVLAYVVALVIYQLGILFSGSPFTLWTAVAILLVLLMGFQLLRKQPEIVVKGRAKNLTEKA